MSLDIADQEISKTRSKAIANNIPQLHRLALNLYLAIAALPLEDSQYS